MGALNADTNVDTIPSCLCDGALPGSLTPLVSLRAKCPKLRLLMATTEVNDYVRNVRIYPDQPHNFGYTLGNLLVVDFRLPFGWTGSLGYFGVTALAAEYAHRNNNQSTAQNRQHDEACEDSGTMGRRRTHAGTQRCSHLAEYGGRAEQPSRDLGCLC